MSKKKTEVFAAIDVGSHTIRMIIGQLNMDGTINTIDELIRRTDIGKDSFSTGRIQLNSIKHICEILDGYKKLIKEYKIKKYRAVCTSGIREAENSEYVLEQIRLKTGLNVEIINNAEERYYIFRALRYLMPENIFKSKEGILIVDIGSGGMEVSVFSDNNLKFTEYLRTGALRMKEYLSGLENVTFDFPNILEEYIVSRINFLKDIIKKYKISKMIGIGGEIKTAATILGLKQKSIEQRCITAEQLNELYYDLRNLSTGVIMEKYNIERYQVDVLIPSLIMFNDFLKATKLPKIFAPLISLRHGVLVDMIDDALGLDKLKEIEEDITNSAWYIGKKYSIDVEHAKHITKLALSIFDQLKKIHKMNLRERLYLKISAILHDVGKYINIDMHDIHSYNIIRSQDIIGLSNEELKLIANVARYHSFDIPGRYDDEDYLIFDIENKIVVSKLAVILRIAEALDISHKQKIKKLEIEIDENEIKFYITANADTALEEWTFNANRVFFEEVMGLKPVIRRKG